MNNDYCVDTKFKYNIALSFCKAILVEFTVFVNTQDTYMLSVRQTFTRLFIHMGIYKIIRLRYSWRGNNSIQI